MVSSWAGLDRGLGLFSEGMLVGLLGLLQHGLAVGQGVFVVYGQLDHAVDQAVVAMIGYKGLAVGQGIVAVIEYFDQLVEQGVVAVIG